jgi:hypothetical protein
VRSRVVGVARDVREVEGHVQPTVPHDSTQGVEPDESADDLAEQFTILVGY